MENKKIIDHGVHVIAYIKDNKKYAMTCAWSMLCDYDKILMLLGSQSVTGKNLKKGDVVARFENPNDAAEYARHLGLSDGFIDLNEVDRLRGN